MALLSSSQYKTRDKIDYTNLNELYWHLGAKLPPSRPGSLRYMTRTAAKANSLWKKFTKQANVLLSIMIFLLRKCLF